MVESRGEPIRCQLCGVSMNRHAEKPVYDGERDAPAARGDWLGAFVEEVHCCASCGRTASRPARD